MYGTTQAQRLRIELKLVLKVLMYDFCLQKWKQGKRKAEKDEYQGGKFFLTLSPPQQALDMRDVYVFYC
jgi:hypothetical protein